MAKKQHRSPDDETRRTRRAVLAMVVAVCLAGGLFLLAWGPWRGGGHGQQGEEHTHLVAPHGGSLASLGLNEPHDHAEAVLEPGGLLALYILEPDATKPRPVAVQILTAKARPEGGGEEAVLHLTPMPLEGDGPGTASRFKGKLPQALWGRSLVLKVPGLAVAGGRFDAEFDRVSPAASRAEHAESERRLYLTPAGKYTRADIEANGSTTARQKYGGHEADHDLAPAAGQWVCPVARLRSTPGYSWVIDGQPYRFCCPPCIDEFVRLAKDEPGRVRKSEEYVKR